VTIANYKEALRKFVSNIGPGGLAVLYGLYDFGSAIFPGDTGGDPSLRSKIVHVIIGLFLLLLGYYWIRRAFSRLCYLRCPSCGIWIGGYTNNLSYINC